jgi:hypothetical protein
MSGPKQENCFDSCFVLVVGLGQALAFHVPCHALGSHFRLLRPAWPETCLEVLRFQGLPRCVTHASRNGLKRWAVLLHTGLGASFMERLITATERPSSAVVATNVLISNDIHRHVCHASDTVPLIVERRRSGASPNSARSRTLFDECF